MNWITNHPRPLAGLWPRRVPAEYLEGPPKETERYSSEELSAMGLIGVYVEMDLEAYRELPIARNPREFREIQNSINEV